MLDCKFGPEDVSRKSRERFEPGATFWKFHFCITIAIFWPIKPSWCNSPTLNFITWLSKRSAVHAIKRYKKKWSRNLPRPLFSGELKQQRQRWLPKRLISALIKWIYVASNFIALIPSRLIRQMLANFLGVEFLRTVSNSGKNRKVVVLCSRRRQIVK